MKHCNGCRYFAHGRIEPICQHPNIRDVFAMIFGPHFKAPAEADVLHMRLHPEQCGPEGKWWEARPPTERP
jgi:hypothetical protein